LSQHKQQKPAGIDTRESSLKIQASLLNQFSRGRPCFGSQLRKQREQFRRLLVRIMTDGFDLCAERGAKRF
jgi:hypothetical protein